VESNTRAKKEHIVVKSSLIRPIGIKPTFNRGNGEWKRCRKKDGLIRRIIKRIKLILRFL